MNKLSNDIAAYEAQRDQLETDHNGEWVVFHDAALVDFFSSFEAAANAAVGRFGRGPYLIRQIGAPPVALPASVMFQPIHA